MLVSLSSLVQRKLHPTGSLECHGLESCWFFFVALSSMSTRIFSTIFFHYTNNLSTFIAQVSIKIIIKRALLVIKNLFAI